MSYTPPPRAGITPELREVDGYELGAEFVPVDEARRLDLNAGQHVFLDAALRVDHRQQGS